MKFQKERPVIATGLFILRFYLRPLPALQAVDELVKRTRQGIVVQKSFRQFEERCRDRIGLCQFFFEVHRVSRVERKFCTAKLAAHEVFSNFGTALDLKVSQLKSQEVCGSGTFFVLGKVGHRDLKQNSFSKIDKAFSGSAAGQMASRRKTAYVKNKSAMKATSQKVTVEMQ
ncbi:MAG: hypothetical protein JSS77_11690 [Acidobacteria bacterium]|nr:hypothetical protein [Acidobacteriota bacterium]